MVRKGQWHDYENGKKKEYGEFVRKARGFIYSRPEPPIYHNSSPRGGAPNKNDAGAVVICLLPIFRIKDLGFYFSPQVMPQERLPSVDPFLKATVSIMYCVAVYRICCKNYKKSNLGA